MKVLRAYPERAPLSDTDIELEDAPVRDVLNILYSLQMDGAESDPEPRLVEFTQDARGMLRPFKEWTRSLESEHGGYLKSFTGKLPGMSVRLALVLSAISAASLGKQVIGISADSYARAVRLVQDYIWPMALRVYGGGETAEETAARALVKLIQKEKWTEFDTSTVRNLRRPGLKTAKDLNPALATLEEGEIIRQIEFAPTSKGGRPPRRFAVNPAILEGT